MPPTLNPKLSKKFHMKTYEEFVQNKNKRLEKFGFTPTEELNQNLFDWQKMLVRAALEAGRYALFEDCGLGKTAQQIEWSNHVEHKTGLPVLIMAPLSVISQTIEEAEKFGMPKITHAFSGDEIGKRGIYITNYERLAKFDSVILGGVVLDESSILKSFSGKTRIALTERFRHVPYRLCCTATPSPNDFTELGQHADFLGICSPAQMLATYFVNDTADTGEWRIKKHAVLDFWRWVSSWASCITKPSDLGFSDEGFELPPLNIHSVWVDVEESGEVGGEDLFRVADQSALTINREMRLTIDARVDKVHEITLGEDQWAVWCNLNDEQDAIESKFGAEIVSVRGSDSDENKIDRERAWRRGEVRNMVSKGSIFGYGMNWQHCHKVVYFPTYSYEDWYQAIRRFYRFGQKNPVDCYVVAPKTANNVLKILKEKAERHTQMKELMQFTRENIIKGAVQNHITMKTDIETVSSKVSDKWTVHNGDCVRVLREKVESESVGFSVFSPPFADLFTYSNDSQDMGNCAGLSDFMEQFGFLIDELHRVMMPGREVAVHCCDLLATKWKDGDIEYKDFSGAISSAFRSRGFLFHSRIAIWKDPVVEMQRTKAHGLLYKTLRGDSSKSRVGSADYLLVFRKRGENPVPITHTPESLPLPLWQELASPVWMTVDQGKVLNGECARDQHDERHICPLQLDVIDRALTLWSAPDDLVLSPFMGIGSEGYCALKMGRRFVGAELKPSYFQQSIANLKTAEEESRTLFSL